MAHGKETNVYRVPRLQAHGKGGLHVTSQVFCFFFCRGSALAHGKRRLCRRLNAVCSLPCAYRALMCALAHGKAAVSRSDTFSSYQSSNKSCTPPYQIPPKHEAPLVLSPYKRTQPAEVLPAKPHVRITYGTGKIRMCFKPSMRAANGNRCLEMHRVGPGFEV